MIADEYQAAVSHAALFDRSAWTKVEVAGPEAQSFLHNLCTNDVKNLSVGAGCEAFLTTAKARVVAHFFVGHFDFDGRSILVLDTVPGQSATLLKTLDHYLISEQVELADRTSELVLLTLCGPEAVALAERVFRTTVDIDKPLHHRKVAVNGTTVYLRRQALVNLGGLDIFCLASHADTIRAELTKAGAMLAGPETFETLRIEAGFPLFGHDIDDNRLVMEVGRSAQAICYTKGCFLGQEPIVMARDRGQVNRTLLGVKFAAGEPLPPGTRLFHGDQEAGQTTSSIRSPRLNHVVAFAYLRRGCQDAGMELKVEPGEDGRTAVVCSLPFA